MPKIDIVFIHAYFTNNLMIISLIDISCHLTCLMLNFDKNKKLCFNYVIYCENKWKEKILSQVFLLSGTS